MDVLPRSWQDLAKILDHFLANIPPRTCWDLPVAMARSYQDRHVFKKYLIKRAKIARYSLLRSYQDRHVSNQYLIKTAKIPRYFLLRSYQDRHVSKQYLIKRAKIPTVAEGAWKAFIFISILSESSDYTFSRPKNSMYLQRREIWIKSIKIEFL